MQARLNARTAVYWTTTVLIALSMLSGSAAYLLRVEEPLKGMAALGYPAYFVTLLGIWKLLGGLALLAPRFPLLKEWAYAGIAFDLSGAAFSHAATGDPAAKVIVPLVLLGIAGLSWALRPASLRPFSPSTTRVLPEDSVVESRPGKSWDNTTSAIGSSSPTGA